MSDDRTKIEAEIARYLAASQPIGWPEPSWTRCIDYAVAMAAEAIRNESRETGEE